MTRETAQAATQKRIAMCRHIAEQLRLLGYDVDWHRVNRSYINFRRWHDGKLALGYLIRLTGIKRI